MPTELTRGGQLSGSAWKVRLAAALVRPALLATAPALSATLTVWRDMTCGTTVTTVARCQSRPFSEIYTSLRATTWPLVTVKSVATSGSASFMGSSKMTAKLRAPVTRQGLAS